MRRTVERQWTRHGARIHTRHPQFGLLYRGRIEPVRGRIDGAGAYGVWRLTDQDHDDLPLLIVGDYLTAEQALLDATAWADEVLTPEQLAAELA
jgi:hypothetical protein